MIHLRPMSTADLPLGLRLKDQAGWNQTAVDWQRVLQLQPEGCFVAEMDGQAVGTTVTTLLGEVAWIAMVLVDEAFRGRGIGTRLMEHALAELGSRAIPTIRLDATPLGRPLYEKLGFQPEYEVVRLEGVTARGGKVHRSMALEASQLEEAIRLDRLISGTDRSRLLRRLQGEQPQWIVGLYHDGEMVGYHSLRMGCRATQIGPAVARDAEAGQALLDEALARCPAGAVLIDVPLDNEPALHWAQQRGLRVQRRLTRMWRGRPVQDQPRQIWASFGPEKG